MSDKLKKKMCFVLQSILSGKTATKSIHVICAFPMHIDMTCQPVQTFLSINSTY